MAATDKLGVSTLIGESLIGKPYPIFFDLHYPMKLNMPPTVTVTGSPGGGKTFFGLLLAAHCNLLQKKTAILDPKGDFRALKMLEYKGYLNSVDVWSLFENNDGEISDDKIGILDPTCFYPKATDNATLTLGIIKTLVGELSPIQENKLTPIIQDVCNEPRGRSLGMIVRTLKQVRLSDPAASEEVRNLGSKLSLILESSFAKLLVRDYRKRATQTMKGIDFSATTIVINLLGIQLPPENKDPKSYDEKEKVCLAIMSLITLLIDNTMVSFPKLLPKTIFIDEAWSLMTNSYSSSMVSKIALLGRSMNMALVLLTQSPTHLELNNGAKLDNTISSRFAFRNLNKDDNIITCSAMDLAANEEWDKLLPALQTGQCLMQDCNKNISVMNVFAPDEWGSIFNTNPTVALTSEKQKTD